MADIMNEEKVCSQNWIYYKSWFLNARFPSPDKLNAHTSGKWEEWDEAKLVDDCTEANIIQTYWDGSCLTTYLLGCDGLDFAICHMELEDGNLEIDSDIEPLKWNEGDEGWYLHEYDEKLLDCNGNETERLYDFDHVENNDVFRVPFEDLDAEAYRNGKVVLTKEAEEKWKKILRGKLPRPVYESSIDEGDEDDEDDDYDTQRKIAAEMLNRLAAELSKNKVGKDIPVEWYLNGIVPETLSANEEYSDVGFDVYGNIVRINKEMMRLELLGRKDLDFALCSLNLYDGELDVSSDTVIKYSYNGWEEWNLDLGKLRDSEGYGLKDFLAFSYATNDMDDSVSDNIFRVPYTDLDMNAFRNGEVVLTKEAVEKWKAIVSYESSLSGQAKNYAVKEDETPNAYFYANNVDVDKVEEYVRNGVVKDDDEDDASQQEGTLIDYFVTINENGVNRDIALYLDSKGLYIKGSAIETLKVMDEGKWYIQTSNGFAKDFSQIEPSPKTYLHSKEWSLEQGTCDIVSKRKKGEDSSGDFNPDLNTLDDLLQL